DGSSWPAGLPAGVSVSPRPRPAGCRSRAAHCGGLASQETINPALVDLTNRNADFGTRMYRAIASRTDENIFLSPFTLSTGLLVLLSATSGSTQEQLFQGLTLTGLDHQSLPGKRQRTVLLVFSDLFRTLRNVVLRRDAANLQQGAAIFPGENFQLSTAFQDLVQNKFGVKAQKLSYTLPRDSEDAINRWAQEQTEGKIQELVPTLDPQTQLLSIVLHLSARFNPPFNSSVTLDERFFVDKYHVVMVPMMFRADKYFLAYDRSVKVGVLKLPMADGAAMLVVLPDEDVDITAVEDEVTSENIQAWIRQLKKTKLEVHKITIWMLGTFKKWILCENLGHLHEPFVWFNNQISGVLNEASFAPQVYHKSVISVDEATDDGIQGRDAAFATPPPRLTINRPFIFIIFQQTTGSLLFMGRVTNPLNN
uniref:Serpin peptidase inhibitor, clade A (alpha-1 antiproteinase, antitrypsin), member 10a n=1 Tax=Oryzias latipes TaxID=8090 RepID=A0A3P9M7E5_ORYLA